MTTPTNQRSSRDDALEEAAQIVLSRVDGVTINRFIFNDKKIVDADGNRDFIALVDVEKMIRAKAEAIRALKSEANNDAG